jgi:predicted amidohydrolase YtcJ
MSPTIFSGVPVYTMNASRSVHQALVVDGTRIGFVGSAEEAAKRYPDAESVVFHRGCVLPGFVDAHLHMREYSLLYRDLDLSGTRHRDEILERVKEASSQRKEEEWITGAGADTGVLEQLGRKDLDAIVSKNPLVLHSSDMGTACVNTAVLLKCQMDESSRNPMGGKIERDSDGKPNGLLRGRAVDLVRRQVPEAAEEIVQDAIVQGVNRLLSRGITTFCDCSIYAPDLLMGTLMSRYRHAGLKCRAVLMYDDRLSARLGSLGMESLFGNEKVHLGGCKLLLDGTLSSMTAAMSRPYAGHESTGMLLMEEAELDQILKRCYAAHIFAAVHAVGDRAVEMALAGFERLARDADSEKLPRRIEHAQTIRDQDVSRFGEIGVIPVVNPAHLPFDRSSALDFLGSRARLQYRLSSLLEGGAALAMGSNAPRGSVNPLYGVYAAVERKDFDEGPELRFFPRECIGLNDALNAYTRGSAAALGLEGEIGSLEPGKCADLVLISEDLSATDLETIRDVRVLMTMVGGDTVYEEVEEGQRN